MVGYQIIIINDCIISMYGWKEMEMDRTLTLRILYTEEKEDDDYSPYQRMFSTQQQQATRNNR